MAEGTTKDKNLTLIRLNEYYKTYIENDNTIYISYKNETDNIKSMENKYFYSKIDDNIYLCYSISNYKYKNDGYDRSILGILRVILQHHDIILSLEETNGYKYGIYNYNRINEIPKSCFNEIILKLYTDSKIRKGYYGNLYKFGADIDFKYKYTEKDKTKLDGLIVEIIEDIILKLKNIFNYTINNDNVFISTATREGKYSLHLSFDIYTTNILDNLYLYTLLGLNKYTYKNIPLFDKTIYIKNEFKCHSLRFLGQSKLNTENSILKPLEEINGFKYGFSENIKDYFINWYSSNEDDIKPIINYDVITEKIIELIKFKGINLTDEEIKNEDFKSALNIINCQYKPSSKYTPLSIKYLKTLINSLEDLNNIEKFVNIYINAIENTRDNRLLYEEWNLIVIILKNIGLKYFNDENHFEELLLTFTKNAYPERGINKILEKARNIFKNTDCKFNSKNVGIPTLKNIALQFDKKLEMNLTAIKTLIKYYNFDGIIPEQIIEKLELNLYNEYKNIFIKAPPGFGKTEAIIKEIVDKSTNDKIFYIILSNRRLFGRECEAKYNKDLEKQNLNPFYNYLDGYIDNEDFKNYIGVILSIQSFDKFFYKIKQHSIKNNLEINIITDEWESLILNIADDKKTNRNEENNFKSLVDAFKYCKKNYIIDAFLSTIAVNIFNIVININEPFDNVKNKSVLLSVKKYFTPYPKTFYKLLSTTKQEQKDRNSKMEFGYIYIAEWVFQKINNDNKNLIVFVEKQQDSKKLKEFLLKKGIDEKDIVLINGDKLQNGTEQEKKDINDLITNINDIKAKIFIHTTAIFNGVNIIIDHFEIALFIINNFGIRPNDAINAGSRSRKTKEIYLSFITDTKILKNITINEDKIKELYEIQTRNYNLLDEKYISLKDAYKILEVLKKYPNYTTNSNFYDDILTLKENDKILLTVPKKQYEMVLKYFKNPINNYTNSLNSIKTLIEYTKNIGIWFKEIMIEELIILSGNTLDTTTFNIVENLRNDYTTVRNKIKDANKINKNIKIKFNNQDKKINKLKELNNIDVDFLKHEEQKLMELKKDVENIQKNELIPKLSTKGLLEKYTVENIQNFEEYGVLPETSFKEILEEIDLSNNPSTNDFINYKILKYFSSNANTKILPKELFELAVNNKEILKIINNIVDIHYKKVKNNPSLKFIIDAFEILQIPIKKLNDASFDTKKFTLLNKFREIKYLADIKRGIERVQKTSIRNTEFHHFINDLNYLLEDINLKLEANEALKCLINGKKQRNYKYNLTSIKEKSNYQIRYCNIYKKFEDVPLIILNLFSPSIDFINDE